MLQVLVGERRFGADQGRQLAGLERPGAVGHDLHVADRHRAEEVGRGAGGLGVARAERRERVDAGLHHELEDAVGLLDRRHARWRGRSPASLLSRPSRSKPGLVLHVAEAGDDAVHGQLAERSGVEGGRVGVVGKRRPHRRIARRRRRRRGGRSGRGRRAGRRRPARLVVGGRRAGERQRHCSRTGAQPELQSWSSMIPFFACFVRRAPVRSQWGALAAPCPAAISAGRPRQPNLRVRRGRALPPRRPAFKRRPGRAAAFLVSASQGKLGGGSARNSSRVRTSRRKRRVSLSACRARRARGASRRRPAASRR